MRSSAAVARQRVDDFNTVKQPDSPTNHTPAGEANSADHQVRPDSAKSDPGIKAADSGLVNGDSGLEKTAAKMQPRVPPTKSEPRAPTNVAPPNSQTPPPPSTPPLPHSQLQPDDAEAVEVSAESPDRELLMMRSHLANTPTTPFGDGSRRQGASRPLQQTATTQQRVPSYFEHAVNLVAARCATDPRSANLKREAAVNDPPPGFGGPRVVYIRQVRPRPMTPLKAWSGYHGNVYFSPLRIEQAKYTDPDSLLSLPHLPDCTGPLRRVLESSRLNAEHLMRLRAHANAAPRQPNRRRWAATAPGGRGGGGPTVVAELDRAFLISRGSGSVADNQDVYLYRSAIATGTLLFPDHQLDELQQPHPQPQHQQFSRVYRGSVSRKLRDLRQALGHPSDVGMHDGGGGGSHPMVAAAATVAGRHNTSMASLDREIDRLYDRVPSLMAGVPRGDAMAAAARRHQIKGGGGGGVGEGGK